MFYAFAAILKPHDSPIFVIDFSQGSIVVKFYIGVINVVYDELSMKNKFNEAYNSVDNPSYVIRSEDTSFTGRLLIMLIGMITTPVGQYFVIELIFLNYIYLNKNMSFVV